MSKSKKYTLQDYEDAKENSSLPSTNPLTWGAEFIVGDVVKIRDDFNNSAEYEICQIEINLATATNTNPHGKLYRFWFSSVQFEGKDLVLVKRNTATVTKNDYNVEAKDVYSLYYFHPGDVVTLRKDLISDAPNTASIERVVLKVDYYLNQYYLDDHSIWDYISLYLLYSAVLRKYYLPPPIADANIRSDDPIVFDNKFEINDVVTIRGDKRATEYIIEDFFIDDRFKNQSNPFGFIYRLSGLINSDWKGCELVLKDRQNSPISSYLDDVVINPFVNPFDDIWKTKYYEFNTGDFVGFRPHSNLDVLWTDIYIVTENYITPSGKKLYTIRNYKGTEISGNEYYYLYLIESYADRENKYPIPSNNQLLPSYDPLVIEDNSAPFPVDATVKLRYNYNDKRFFNIISVDVNDTYVLDLGSNRKKDEIVLINKRDFIDNPFEPASLFLYEAFEFKKDDYVIFRRFDKFQQKSQQVTKIDEVIIDSNGQKTYSIYTVNGNLDVPAMHLVLVKRLFDDYTTDTLVNSVLQEQPKELNKSDLQKLIDDFIVDNETELKKASKENPELHSAVTNALSFLSNKFGEGVPIALPQETTAAVAKSPSEIHGLKVGDTFKNIQLGNTLFTVTEVRDDNAPYLTVEAGGHYFYPDIHHVALLFKIQICYLVPQDTFPLAVGDIVVIEDYPHNPLVVMKLDTNDVWFSNAQNETAFLINDEVIKRIKNGSLLQLNFKVGERFYVNTDVQTVYEIEEIIFKENDSEVKINNLKILSSLKNTIINFNTNVFIKTLSPSNVPPFQPTAKPKKTKSQPKQQPPQPAAQNTDCQEIKEVIEGLSLLNDADAKAEIKRLKKLMKTLNC